FQLSFNQLYIFQTKSCNCKALHMPSSASIQKQTGFSLIEVLVTLLIMTLGIVGVLKLQTQSLKSNQRAHFRTQADILSKDMLARMQANSREAKKGSYVADSKPENAPDCQTQACNAAQLVTWDLYQWYEQIEDKLPAGSATLETIGGDNQRYLVSLRWDDRRDSEILDTQACGNESGKMLCWGTVVQL
ncbi:MAG: type IV pilus modification protein PilV, partial [Gammaproteobacteria bacterium]|nr:type IV pilus modification protein PilV [Gammaproteobacteria bacterium]